ncbi:AAA family ATPase [Saccharicrinis aurantiacus]|uniref:AAA family ATPase n=1 Tax=Saccharicrinis aurantiacus TaxID=1849719 RepID=UPI00094FE55D|nr:AAA family ATPase [Saccharicrinis aurantiacus]
MTNLQKNLNGRIISLNSKVYNPSSLKTAKELADEGSLLEPLKCIWGSYILENSLVHNPSERGTGKTLLSLQICLAVSSGWSSFCGEKIEINGNTLLINFELDEDMFKRRLDNLFKSPPTLLNQSKYQTRVYTTTNTLQEELHEISEIVDTHKPVLIVIDNFKLAFRDSDGNSNRDAIIAMRELLNLRSLSQCSIVLVDHTRKNTRALSTESDLQSGAGSKSDLADGDFFLRKSTKNESYRILKRSKSRNCADQVGAKLLHLNPESLWFEVIEENVDELEHLGQGVFRNTDEKKEIAMSLRDSGNTMEQIAATLGKSKSTISRWLKE